MQVTLHVEWLLLPQLLTVTGMRLSRLLGSVAMARTVTQRALLLPSILLAAA
jgi:hypothetical protein